MSDDDSSENMTRSQPPRCAVIVKVDTLGDLVVFAPVLHALRKAWPDTRLVSVIRRAYLDATGRLPKIEESVAFLNDPSPDKRDRVIDELLDSPDYAAFWTLKWSDILRSNSKKLNAVGVYKFRQWIYDNIRNDTPVDEFARELLTAAQTQLHRPGPCTVKQ